MSKTILFCADGTWNGPGKDDSDDANPTTNVLKLFASLQGDDTPESIRLRDEQERVLHGAAGPVQVAKYLHGVGDSQNQLVRLLGGVFGTGTITRIVRGYTFISRNYQLGDRIVLVGFSRGAYTVRALAGLIIGKGLLNPASTDLADKAAAYRAGTAAWYAYRKAQLTDGPFWQRFSDAITNLPAFLSRDLPSSGCLPGVGIEAIGVWDTVGSLGIPTYALDGHRADIFQFVNKDLSPLVRHGVHAVSIDEQRRDFLPTLWNDRPQGNIIQSLFAGAHADVGGGYPAAESGLSDITLGWMQQQLVARAGLLLASPLKPTHPDPLAIAHQPWTNLPWNLPALDGHPTAVVRTFPDIASSLSLGLNESVVTRWLTFAGMGYRPSNVAHAFDANGSVLPKDRIYA
jgi:uncharacterized protein (DUF2235 family)